MRISGILAAVLLAAGVAFLAAFSFGRSGADEPVVNESAAAGAAPSPLKASAGPQVSGLHRVAVHFPVLAKPAATATSSPNAPATTPTPSATAPTPTATPAPVIPATPTPDDEEIGTNPH